MLCVDLSALKKDPQNVQRDVDLEDIINNHTRQYPTREDAARDNYAPLNFCISVRSMLTNLVVSTKMETKTLNYTNITNVGDFPHKGYDLVMYVSSLGVLSMCEFSPLLEEVMTRHSQFQPIGICNPDPDFIDPMVYSHVIMSDEGMMLLCQCLKPECSVTPIQSMNTAGNIKSLLDTLIIVKEEKTHAERDNQPGDAPCGGCVSQEPSQAE